MAPVKRGYHAPIREEQAARTRERIAEGAAVEFAAHGWGGATVAGIAARAGVTPQGVHLAVGGKAALLIRAIESRVAGATDERPLAERPAFTDVYRAGVTIQRRLEALAAATAEIYARAARLFLALQDAVAQDPSVAALAEQAASRRLADCRTLARLLLPDSPGDAVDRLADTIWVLVSPGVYVDLVERRGWTNVEYEAWLAQQVRAARSAYTKTGPSRRR